MKFNSEAYQKGKSISTVANIFVVILLIAGISGSVINKKKRQQISEKNDN
jgi:hypothetical protein